MAVRGNKAVGEQLVKNYKDGDACPLATYKAENLDAVRFVIG